MGENKRATLLVDYTYYYNLSHYFQIHEQTCPKGKIWGNEYFLHVFWLAHASKRATGMSKSPLKRVKERIKKNEREKVCEFYVAAAAMHKF